MSNKSSINDKEGPTIKCPYPLTIPILTQRFYADGRSFVLLRPFGSRSFFRFGLWASFGIIYNSADMFRVCYCSCRQRTCYMHLLCKREGNRHCQSTSCLSNLALSAQSSSNRPPPFSSILFNGFRCTLSAAGSP